MVIVVLLLIFSLPALGEDFSIRSLDQTPKECLGAIRYCSTSTNPIIKSDCLRIANNCMRSLPRYQCSKLIQDQQSMTVTNFQNGLNNCSRYLDTSGYQLGKSIESWGLSGSEELFSKTEIIGSVNRCRKKWDGSDVSSMLIPTDLSQREIKQSFKDSELEIFDEELTYLISDKDSAFESFGDIVRIQFIANSLKANCQNASQNIDISKLSPKCSRFQTGIKKFQCTENDKERLSDNSLKDFYNISKKILELNKEKWEIVSAQNLVQEEMVALGVAKCFAEGTGDTAVDSQYQKVTADYYRLGKDIEKIDNQISTILKAFPLYLAGIEKGKQLSETDLSDVYPFVYLKRLNRFKYSDVKAIFKRTEDMAANNALFAINNICDEEKTPLNLLLQMDNLTSKMKGVISGYAALSQCISNELGIIRTVKDSAVGVACLGAMIPAATTIVGGTCAAYFFGQTVAEYNESENIASFARSCESLGEEVCTSEEAKKLFEKAQGSYDSLVMALIIDVPLDLVDAGVLRAVKTAVKSASLGLRQAGHLFSSVQRDMKKIAKISTPSKRLAKVKELLDEISKNPKEYLLNSFKRTSVADYPVISRMNISKRKKQKLLDEIKIEMEKRLKECKI